MLNNLSQKLSKFEIYRKSLHLLGCFIPFIYYFTNFQFMLFLLVFLLIFTLGLDYIRFKTHPSLFKLIKLDLILRKHETHGFSALSYAFIALLICLIISTEPVFNLATLILVFADTAAAIIGITYGKNKFFGKSIQGCLAFFFTAILLSFLITIIYHLDLHFLLSAMLASALATIVELFSKNSLLNDNFSIPISICLVMLLLT